MLKYKRKNKRGMVYYSDRLEKYITIKEATNLSEKWGYPKTYAGMNTYIRKAMYGVPLYASCTLDDLICWKPIHQRDRNFKNRANRWSKTTKLYEKRSEATSMLDEMLNLAHKAIKPYR